MEKELFEYAFQWRARVFPIDCFPWENSHNSTIELLEMPSSFRGIQDVAMPVGV